ncbi:MAG: hypothetical protein ACK4IC_00110 [Erythrobacter sp.]
MSQPFTNAQLAAFLDGTLADEALTDAIEAAINTDAALAERVEALAGADETAAAVRDAFASVLAAPVPEHLTRIVAAPASAQVVELAAVRAARTLPAPANDTGGTWRWPQFAAMAASLVIGVMIGGPLLTGGGGGDSTGGSLVLASADLDTMLDRAPSGQSVDLASLGTGEVVLTFRNADGQLCRQFMIEGAGATSDALACADASGSWQVEAYGRRAAPAGEMKLAGGDAAPAVVAAVDAMIASDVLVGADEAAELAKQ